jgi:hypothetical protein
VIIDEIDVKYAAIFESKDDAPVRPDRDGPETLQVPFST